MKLSKISDSIEGDLIKNKDALNSFIQNLNLISKEKQLLQNYITKMINQIDLLGNQNQKLKSISKNLLENY